MITQVRPTIRCLLNQYECSVQCIPTRSSVAAGAPGHERTLSNQGVFRTERSSAGQQSADGACASSRVPLWFQLIDLDQEPIRAADLQLPTKALVRNWLRDRDSSLA